jgi:hypothetical protein
MRIGVFILRGGEFVDSIELVYLDGKGGVRLVKHGGDGGDQRVERGPVPDLGEFVTEISGKSGQFVDSLTIETNQPGVRLGVGGSGGGPVEGYELPPDTDPPQEIIAFFGASGTLIDRIGIHTRPHAGSPG